MLKFCLVHNKCDVPVSFLLRVIPTLYVKHRHPLDNTLWRNVRILLVNLESKIPTSLL